MRPAKPEDVNIEDHLRLAHAIVRRYGWARQGVDYDDAIQVALVAMVRARQTWRPELGAWSSYAALWIRARCGRYLADHGATVRVPVARQQSRRKAGEAPRASVSSLDRRIADDTSERGATHLDLISYPPGQGLEAEPEAQEQLERLIDRTPALTERERQVMMKRASGMQLSDPEWRDRECERQRRYRAGKKAA